MKFEFIKEKLIFYRLLLTVALTTFCGCCAWFFINFGNVESVRMLISAICAILLAVALFATVKRIRYYLNQIREIEND